MEAVFCHFSREKWKQQWINRRCFRLLMKFSGVDEVCLITLKNQQSQRISNSPTTSIQNQGQHSTNLVRVVRAAAFNHLVCNH